METAFELSPEGRNDKTLQEHEIHRVLSDSSDLYQVVAFRTV